MTEPLPLVGEDEDVERVVAFHGHVCPGLAMGIQAARYALAELGERAEDEEIVAVVETDMCGVDAIQVLLGATFGKGNLVHRDWGKSAFTFFSRSDGRGFRLSTRPDAWGRDPEDDELFTNVRSGEATEEEAARLRALRAARTRRLLNSPPEDLFDIRPVDDPPPRKARIYGSVECGNCGESTMETRIRLFGGRELCPPCFEAADAGAYQLTAGDVD
jgi:formylmethanofuran dehydrogenase subunit E